MGNKFQVKRTAVSGRTANTSVIDVGELALNITDGKMFSSNGTNIFEIGANVSSLNVAGMQYPTTDGTNGYVLTTNGEGTLYWAAGGTGGVITVSFSDIEDSSVITSSEAFADVDNQLMSAAAINDLIESKGYITTETDNQTLTWTSANGDLSISNGNSVNLDGRYLTNVSWAEVTDKPATFPPSAHTHVISDVTNLQSELDSKATTAQGALADTALQPLDNISELTNDVGYITGFTETDPTVPSHVKTITTTEKTNWNSAFAWGDHSAQGYLTSVSWSIITDKPATFPPSAHTHVISDVTGLQSALDGKVDDSQVLTDVPIGAVFTDTVYTHPNHSGDVVSVSDGSTTLQPSAITGKTALTSGLASTDEMLVSDAGILKRMDVSVLQSYLQTNLLFNNYTHPSHPGDDINVDTGPLTGATVISDLDFNVTTDTQGHVTDANAIVSTRNLTPANIGAEPAFTKNTGFNKDFGTTVGTVAQGNDSRIVNGQTAFGWGNHASAGYLTTVSWESVTGKPLTFVPSAHTHVKDDITDFNEADYATAAQGALASTAIQTETDPTVPAHVKSIQTTDISTWNAALQPAANISSLTNDAGYITGYVEVDTLASVTDRGSTTLNSITIGGLHIDSTGAVELPAGTTAQQPAGVAGMFRFNSETASFEGYNGTEWGAIAGGGGGATFLYKNAAYTAEPNDYVMADTSSSAFTLTLPASPEEGAVVYIGDYASSFSANNLTVARNGSTIEGSAADAVLSITNSEYLFLYLNADWKVFTTKTLAGITSERYLVGPTTGNEGTNISLYIQGWTINDTYTISVTGGSYTQTNDLIVWTLPGVDSDTKHTMTLTLTGGGTHNHDVYVINIPVSPDTSISVTNFSVNQTSTGWTIS